MPRAVPRRWPPSANGDGEQLRAWVDKIAINTHRAGEIIRRLRGFTKKSEPRRETVDAGSLVEEVIELMEAETRLRNVRVRWEPRHTAAVLVDPIQIQQVLVNLLRNAYDAMSACPSERRQVTIATAPRDGHLELAVEDRGEGIRPEHQDRVFDAFFTSKANGVGIGLAISRSIVEDHGGRLWVTPNSADGVTFRLTLPLGIARLRQQSLRSTRSIPPTWLFQRGIISCKPTRPSSSWTTTSKFASRWRR